MSLAETSMRIILEGGQDELPALINRLRAGERVVLRLDVETALTDEESMGALSPLGQRLVGRGLRPRLARLVELDASGYTRQEIAAALGLTVETISTYWREVYRTLKIDSRAAVRALVGELQQDSSFLLSPEVDRA